MARPRQTHCKRGHRYDDPGNSVFWKRKDGTSFRVCKPCEKIRREQRRESNRKASYDPRENSVLRKDWIKSVRRGPYAHIVKRFHEGDVVHDVESSFDHKNRGLVVSVHAGYGTVRVRLADGSGMVSIFGGNLRILESARAAS